MSYILAPSGTLVYLAPDGIITQPRAGWLLEYLTERRRRNAKISQLLHPTGRSA
nr:MAG TPA: hypothetical protein [Caudoviricetes sp.]